MENNEDFDIQNSNRELNNRINEENIREINNKNIMNNLMNQQNMNDDNNSGNKSMLVSVVVLIVFIVIGIFVFTQFDNNDETDNTMDDNTQEQRDNNQVISEQIYKTSDGKYIFKLLDNGKAFINDKEIIVDNKEENNRYIEIQGDFNPSPNFIAGLGFILDKNTKLIIDEPHYDENDKSSECGYENYGEYARFCTRCYGFNILTINNWSFFERWNEIGASGIYTTDWKKLGYADVDNIKFDNDGIYVCNDYFESACESGETKYDVNGNIVNN